MKMRDASPWSHDHRRRTCCPVRCRWCTWTPPPVKNTIIRNMDCIEHKYFANCRANIYCTHSAACKDKKNTPTYVEEKSIYLEIQQNIPITAVKTNISSTGFVKDSPMHHLKRKIYKLFTLLIASKRSIQKPE